MRGRRGHDAYSPAVSSPAARLGAVLAAGALALAGCSSEPSPPGITASGTSSTSPAADPSTGSGTPSLSPSDAQGQIVPSAPSGAATGERAARQVAPPAGIGGLLAWDTSGYPAAGDEGPGTVQHDHVDGPVTYAMTPPVGGPHAPVWMNAGVYTRPVPNERAVHAMEHGAVWITYAPTLPTDQVSALTAFVAGQSLIAEQGSEAAQAGQANRYVVMSPWGGDALPSPIVISSWGYQLRVTSPGDPRLQQFLDTFRASATYSPEPGSPVDGVPVLTGGRAASNGGVVPNPPGAVG